MSEQSAAEKLRLITDWLNWQSEETNDKFKTISDIEIAFDFCREESIEFCDNLKEYGEELYDKLCEKLGYKI